MEDLGDTKVPRNSFTNPFFEKRKRREEEGRRREGGGGGGKEERGVGGRRRGRGELFPCCRLAPPLPKPKENQRLGPKDQQNLRKTNVWDSRTSKTLRKAMFGTAGPTKLKENQCL